MNNDDIDDNDNNKTPLSDCFSQRFQRVSPFHRSFGGPQNRLARMLDPPSGRLSVARERLKRCVVSLQNEDFSNHLRVLKKFHPWISQVHFEDEETESTAQNSYNRRESAYLRDHLPEAFRRAIARFNDVDMVLYEQGVEQFYQQVTLARKTQVTLPASHLVPSKITLPAKDWESTWPFFQQQLPTTFFMRRVLRCKITRLASQCARLIGTSMPDGVPGWWLFSNIFLEFSPRKIGEDEPILTKKCFKLVVGSTTRWIICSNKTWWKSFFRL